MKRGYVLLLAFFFAASCLAQAQAILGGGRIRAPRASGPVAVSDDFNRANAPLGGPNWTATPSDRYTIASNALATSGGATGGVGLARWTANTFSANQYAEASYVPFGNTGKNRGLCVRMGSDGLSGYCLVHSAATVWKLTRVTTSFFATTLATCTGWPSTPTPLFIRLEVSGSNVSGFMLASHGGAVTYTCTATSTAWPSGGGPVIVTATSNSGTFDDFYAGDIP